MDIYYNEELVFIGNEYLYGSIFQTYQNVDDFEYVIVIISDMYVNIPRNSFVTKDEFRLMKLNEIFEEE